MDPFRALLPRLFGLALLVYGYVLALREWGQGLPDELEPTARAAVRRQAHLWCGAALLLVGVLVAAWAYALGPARAAGFLGGPGTVLLLQATAVLVLLPVGAAWAARLGHAPLHGNRPAGRGARRLAEWLAVIGAMLGWTLLLMQLVPHRAVSMLPGRFMLEGVPPVLQWPMLVALLTLAPITEEIFFRQYLMHRIAATWRAQLAGTRPKLVAAIAFCTNAALFALAHYGSLEPFWLRFVQTFALGLILSAVAWRHGLAAAIATHWGYNLALAGSALLARAG